MQQLTARPELGFSRHWVAPLCMQIQGRTAPFATCAPFLAATPTCANTSVSMSPGSTSWLLEPVAGTANQYTIRAAVSAICCLPRAGLEWKCDMHGMCPKALSELD